MLKPVYICQKKQSSIRKYEWLTSCKRSMMIKVSKTAYMYPGKQKYSIIAALFKILEIHVNTCKYATLIIWIK